MPGLIEFEWIDEQGNASRHTVPWIVVKDAKLHKEDRAFVEGVDGVATLGSVKERQPKDAGEAGDKKQGKSQASDDSAISSASTTCARTFLHRASSRGDPDAADLRTVLGRVLFHQKVRYVIRPADFPYVICHWAATQQLGGLTVLGFTTPDGKSRACVPGR